MQSASKWREPPALSAYSTWVPTRPSWLVRQSDSNTPVQAFNARISAPRAQALPSRCVAARAKPSRAEASADLERRAVLMALATTAIASASPLPALASPQVGSYLPSAGIDDLVLFVPDSKKTPAIRAGTVDPNHPYRFAVPPSWAEKKVR